MLVGASEDAAAPPVDLRQVLYFVTVAGELNFSRAAARLHISPPALSQQVKSLERHLGVQLLVRDTRHVRLTPAGERFARASQTLLDAGADAVRDVRDGAGLLAGSLVVASLHEAEVAFEPLLTRFHAACPGIRVSVGTMRHAQLVEAVRDRSADAGLTWSFLLGIGEAPSLASLRVARTEVVAALPPSSALAHLRRVPRGEALRGTPAVLFERAYSPATFDYAVEHLYGPGYADPPVHEVSVTVRAQEAMARELARSDGLAPLSRPVADAVGGALAIRPFDPPWWLDGCVVWQRDNRSAPLVAFLTAAAGESARARDGADGVHDDVGDDVGLGDHDHV